MKRILALVLGLIMLLALTAPVHADAGTTAADLGFSYLRGEGVTQDYGKALEYFLQADQAGDRQVQFSIGEMYEFGRGVKRDLVTAVKWYIKASQFGVSEATLKLTQEPLKSIQEAMSVQEQATHVPGTFGDVEGVRGPTRPLYLDNPLINLNDLTLVLTFKRWVGGWPYGNWYLYVRDARGEWHHTSIFKLDKSFGEGDTLALQLKTDQSETVTAFALCPADKGMDYTVQFDMVFIVSEENIGEYSDTIPRPNFTPASSDPSKIPALSVHFKTGSYKTPDFSLLEDPESYDWLEGLLS